MANLEDDCGQVELIPNKMRERWTGIAANEHFACMMLPEMTWRPNDLDGVPMTQRNGSERCHYEFSNITSKFGTGLRHLLSHTKPDWNESHGMREEEAMQHAEILLPQDETVWQDELLSDFLFALMSKTAQRPWKYFQKLISFGLGPSDYLQWCFDCLFEFISDFGNRIFLVVSLSFRDMLHWPISPRAKTAVFSLIAPDMYPMEMHEFGEIAADEYFLLTRWLHDCQPDFDPRFIEFLIASFCTWMAVFAGFLLWLACGEVKRRFMIWIVYSPGIARRCGKARVVNARHAPLKCKILRLILFGWLITSPHAIDAIKPFCDVENVDPIPGANLGQSETWSNQKESHIMEQQTYHDAEALPYGIPRQKTCLKWIGLTRRIRSCHMMSLIDWPDFCECTEDLLCTATGSDVGLRLSDTFAPCPSPSCKCQQGSDKVELTGCNDDEFRDDNTWLMQMPILMSGETCGRHPDALLYWDQLAFRPPIVTTRFFVWLTDIANLGHLQTQF